MSDTILFLRPHQNDPTMTGSFASILSKLEDDTRLKVFVVDEQETILALVFVPEERRRELILKEPRLQGVDIVNMMELQAAEFRIY